MNRLARIAILTAVAGAGLFAAWRIVGLIRADAALAAGNPEASLRFHPADPDALLALAERHLQQGDLAEATAAAQALLRAKPIEGRGYRVLAEVAERRQQPERALALYRIAVKRAPRDARARAWLAEQALVAGDHAEALHQIDRVLVLRPAMRTGLFPLLARMAEDPEFADSLATVLASRPPWRAGLLAYLQASREAPDAGDQVLAALQRKGGLDQGEFNGWIDALLKQGRWGEAHARWAGPQLAAGHSIPLLFNGDFARAPTGSGFDWRLPRVPGVLVDFEPRAPSGQAMRLRFLGRRVAGGIARHPLLLAPGRYRLSWRQKTEALDADPGIEWRLSCAARSQALAASMPMRGASGWREVILDFEVPAEGCGGQWLALGTAGARSAGQIASGGLWLAQVRIAGRP